MKNSLIIFAALIVAVLGRDEHGIKAAHKKCHTDRNLELTEVTNDPEDDASFKHFSHWLCVNKELKLVNEEGKVEESEVRKHVALDVADPEKVDAIVAKCAKDKENVLETIKKLWICLKREHIFKRRKHWGRNKKKHHSSEEHLEEGEDQSSTEGKRHHHRSHHKHHDYEW